MVGGPFWPAMCVTWQLGPMDQKWNWRGMFWVPDPWWIFDLGMAVGAPIPQAWFFGLMTIGVFFGP